MNITLDLLRPWWFFRHNKARCSVPSRTDHSGVNSIHTYGRNQVSFLRRGIPPEITHLYNLRFISPTLLPLLEGWYYTSVNVDGHYQYKQHSSSNRNVFFTGSQISDCTHDLTCFTASFFILLSG